MEIRYLGAKDDPLAISAVYEASWKFTYRGIVPQDYLDEIPAGHWVTNLHREGMHHLLAVEDGQIIGTACFAPSRWDRYGDYGELVSIYFLPDHTGRGYGKALLNRCIEELHQRGFPKVLLWVLEENHSARRFYEKNGFICSEAYLNDRIGGKELREVMYYRAPPV